MKTQTALLVQHQAPIATRPDGNYPEYKLGEESRLIVTTNPLQANEPVFLWRAKDNEVEFSETEIGRTDENGVFSVSVLLTDPKTVGTSTNEHFTVGSKKNPKSDPLNFEVSDPNSSK